MPPSLIGNAATTPSAPQSPEMEVGRAAGRQSPSALTATNDGAVAQVGSGMEKKNKQSMDYVLRSGLAGGLAGCAVRIYPPTAIR